MNIRILAKVIGGFVTFLGLAGLLSGENQLLNLMNTDIMLDVMRIVLGGILIAGSYMSDRALKTTYVIFGVIYLGNFIIALMSQSMYGLLPHEFGIVDNTLHLGGGLLALVIAFLPVGSTKVRYAA